MIKVGKKNVIKCLQNLASYDFQKQAWFASTGPVVSSFTEDVCQLFNDTGLDLALGAGETVFGKPADKCLRELEAIVDKINYKVSPKVLLDDPLMQTVREKAAETLRLISASTAPE